MLEGQPVLCAWGSQKIGGKRNCSSSERWSIDTLNREGLRSVHQPSRWSLPTERKPGPVLVCDSAERVQDIEVGSVHPVGPKDRYIAAFVITLYPGPSPDGKSCIQTDGQGHYWLQLLEGGSARELSGIAPGEKIINWHGDSDNAVNENSLTLRAKQHSDPDNPGTSCENGITIGNSNAGICGTKRGKPHRLVIGDELPKQAQVLPTPEQVREQ